MTSGLWLLNYSVTAQAHTLILTMYLHALYALPVLWLIWNAYIMGSVTIWGIITTPAAFKASQAGSKYVLKFNLQL